MQELFRPLALGELRIPNRIVMAAMTRARADDQGRPCPQAVDYYAARADAGLIVTEATDVGPSSGAFERAPGIWTDDQARAWAAVVAEVQARGGRIALQLSHAGRVGADCLNGGRRPLSPSGIDLDIEELEVWGLLANGAYARLRATPSRAMTERDIDGVLDAYASAARRARTAGFDAIEIQAGDGHLLHQFLSPRLNLREDGYGGGPGGRARLLRDVLAAVGREMPASRVGVRLTPFARCNGAWDPSPADTLPAAMRVLEDAGVAYVQIADAGAWADTPGLDAALSLTVGRGSAAVIANGGIAPKHAARMVGTGACAAVAFARPFLANPDFVSRVRIDGPYNGLKRHGLYGGGREGYLDYLTLQEEEPADVGLA